MDRIGEIDRRGATRERDQVALGREAEHLILEHLELGILEKFLRVGGMLQNIEQLAQPAILLSLGLAAVLLVAPVCRDAQLGDLVHLAGTDLHLDALTLRPDDAGMERAVIVGLGRRDIVFEPARHDRVMAVDDAQRLVALLDRFDRDTEGHDVG